MENYRSGRSEGKNKFVIAGLNSLNNKRSQLSYDRYENDRIYELQEQLDRILKRKIEEKQVKKRKNKKSMVERGNQFDLQVKKNIEEIKDIISFQASMKEKQLQPLSSLPSNFRRSNKSYHTPKSQFKSKFSCRHSQYIYCCESLQNKCFHCKPMNHCFCRPCFHKNEDKSQKMMIDRGIGISIKQIKIGQRKTRSKLKRVFLAVLFVFLFRHHTRKLIEFKKMSFQRYQKGKFENHVQNVMDWLLDAQKQMLEEVLEKEDLVFILNPKNRDKIREQKLRLVLNLLQISTTNLLQSCTITKSLFFSELLANLCQNRTFPKPKFWTKSQLRPVKISQQYGLIKANDNVEKYLIGVLVWIKILIFNMLLQPHKLDDENFPQGQQPLTSNMHFLSSAYYYLVKQVLNTYLSEEPEPQVHNRIQYGEPLIYGKQQGQQNELISGLHSEDTFSFLFSLEGWQVCKQQIKRMIEILHRQMKIKGKQINKNLRKFTLY